MGEVELQKKEVNPNPKKFLLKRFFSSQTLSKWKKLTNKSTTPKKSYEDRTK